MGEAAAASETRSNTAPAAKAATAARREVASLLGSIERRALAVGKDCPGSEMRVRRTPERCVVQAGRVGLSVSWLQPQANTAAEAALLVMEWDGIVTLHGEPPTRSRRATLVRERALSLGPDGSNWLWRTSDSPARAFTSDELAYSCVQQLLRRVEAPAADAR